MLIDTFVNAIYLYDDKVVITFNYKDGTKTVSFSELNAALTEQRSGSDLDCSGAPKPCGCNDHRVFLLALYTRFFDPS